MGSTSKRSSRATMRRSGARGGLDSALHAPGRPPALSVHLGTAAAGRCEDPSMDSPKPVDTLTITERTRLRRFAPKGSHDRADLYAVLDAGFVCHLGLQAPDGPMVLPTSYGREGDRLYLHGSVASRSLRSALGRVPMCVTVTHIDGIVLARSVFEHAVNYRSALIYGTPEVLTEPLAKTADSGPSASRSRPASGGTHVSRPRMSSPSRRCSSSTRRRSRPVLAPRSMAMARTQAGRSGPGRSRCARCDSTQWRIPPSRTPSSSPLT